MTGTEETPVVASKAEEVVKLNNSFKEACVITKSEQVDDKEKSHSRFLILYILICIMENNAMVLPQCYLKSTNVLYKLFTGEECPPACGVSLLHLQI